MDWWQEYRTLPWNWCYMHWRYGITILTLASRFSSTDCIQFLPLTFFFCTFKSYRVISRALSATALSSWGRIVLLEFRYPGGILFRQQQALQAERAPQEHCTADSLEEQEENHHQEERLRHHISCNLTQHLACRLHHTWPLMPTAATTLNGQRRSQPRTLLSRLVSLLACWSRILWMWKSCCRFLWRRRAKRKARMPIWVTIRTKFQTLWLSSEAASLCRIKSINHTHEWDQSGTWYRLILLVLTSSCLVHALPFSLLASPMPTRWATMTKDHARYKLHAIPNAFLCQPSPGLCSLWAYLAFRSLTFWPHSLLFVVVVMVAFCSDSRLRSGLPSAKYAMLRVCPHSHLTYFIKMRRFMCRSVYA